MKGVISTLQRPIVLTLLLLAILALPFASLGSYELSTEAKAAVLAGPPEISGESAIVLDGSNGDILYEKNSHLRVAPASVTKIATAIVAIEKGDIDQRIIIDFDSFQMVVDTESTVMGLKPGDVRSLKDLLYGLMLPSGNDAAVVIAQTIGGTEDKFVKMMNDKVEALGLKDTHFSNPHGLDAPDHYSSAHDMAALSLYGMRYPTFRSLSETKKYEIRGNRPYELWNLNRLLYSYDGADGVKIGYTENALETIVASATRDGQKLIVAVMRSNFRYGDSRLLLDYYFEALKTGQVTRIPRPTITPTPTPTIPPAPATSAVPAPVAPLGGESAPAQPSDEVDFVTGILNTVRSLLSFVGL